MKLYRVPHDDPDHGNCQVWCGTQAEAKKKVKELEQQFERWRVGAVEAVEIPTDKPGLIAWLNSNFNTDNG